MARSKKPNSFCEWVLGGNYASRKKTTHRRVASFTWDTDEETDTVSLSIPRGQRQSRSTRSKHEKHVRFSEKESTDDAKEVSHTTR